MAPSVFQLRMISRLLLVLDRCVGTAARFVVTVLYAVLDEA